MMVEGVVVVVGPRRPLQVDDVIDPELSSSPMPEISIGELVTCLSTRDLRRAAGSKAFWESLRLELGNVVLLN